jgi:ABC-type branched-subunit amino acid transport system ATPase component
MSEAMSDTMAAPTASNTAVPALEVRGVNKNFGALQVARDVNLTLERGARRALIGPNGAGKTSLVNLITGVLKPSSGQVLLGGEDITSWSSAHRARRGLARTFQINQLFRGLSVLENVCLAIGERRGESYNLWRPAGSKAAVIDEALDHLNSLRLVDDALKLVSELPYGRQRLVEIAIALAQKPKVLLLDEPAAGVPSHESHVILDVVASLDPDIAILIIEHDMDVVFRFAQSITVLVAGAVLTEGSPQQILADERVRAVYLGQEADRGHG